MKRFSFIVFIPLLFFSTAFADIIPIDLNDFYADPIVTVASDGSSATMEENNRKQPGRWCKYNLTL